MKQITHEQILVTPTIAKKWLEEGNLENRRLRLEYAKNLASQMIEKGWRDNTGVPIIFDEDGVLIDGQHRLTAVVIANTPIKFSIVRNVSREVQDVIDTGLNRQASDVLTFSGVKNSGAIASLIKFKLGNASNGGSKTRAGAVLVTNRLIKEEYLKNPEFWQSLCLRAQSYYKQFRALPISVFGGCEAIALEQSRHPKRVSAFFSALASGSTDSPAILELRKKIINNQLSDKKYTTIGKRDLIKSYFNGYIKDQKNPYNHPENIWL